MNRIIELLEESGLTTQEAVKKTVLRWPAREALGFALAMSEGLDRKGDLVDANAGGQLTPFNFVASSILGGRFGCGEWSCRVRRSQLLGRYADLYSDTLVVPWHVQVAENRKPRQLPIPPGWRRPVSPRHEAAYRRWDYQAGPAPIPLLL